ncbi:MAG: hypothetical protein KAT58_10325 [candidate division Zixibacteria bacterium]|nr:hypothetical protein [candidate division Zixibacteria bacterium]
MTDSEWDRLNAAISADEKSLNTERHFTTDLNTLDQMRLVGSQHIGWRNGGVIRQLFA